MPEILRFPCRVLKVEERHTMVYKSGLGENAITETKSLGWYIVLDNFIALPCGSGKPEFTFGDTVRLTLEKHP